MQKNFAEEQILQLLIMSLIPHQKLMNLLKAKFPLVIKVDGLAAGKGVIICESLNEAENSINLIMKKKIWGRRKKNYY